MRAVLDPNILIAALLAPNGAQAQLVGRWLGGVFELVVSEALLAELERALAYPKLRARITAAEATELTVLLRDGAIVAADPPNPPHRSADPVSGDQHVLALAGELPVLTARAFLGSLGDE